MRGLLVKTLGMEYFRLDASIHKLNAVKRLIKCFLIVPAPTLGWSLNICIRHPLTEIIQGGEIYHFWNNQGATLSTADALNPTRHIRMLASIRWSHGHNNWWRIRRTADMVQQDRGDTRNWPEQEAATISGAEAGAVTWFLVRALSAHTHHHHHSYPHRN